MSPTTDPVPIDLEDALLAGELNVIAVTLPVTSSPGIAGGIVFEFVNPDGVPYPPMVYVGDDIALMKIAQAVKAGANHAVRTAKAMRDGIQ